MALVAAAEPKDGPDSSSRVALYSLGTVAAYAECRQELSHDGFLDRLREMTGNGRDRTSAKYASRVLDRVAGGDRK